jgi:hypothetical protein
MSLLDDVSIVVTPNGYKAGELYAVIPVPDYGTQKVINGDFSSGSADWTPYDSTFVVSNANPYDGNDTALFTASGVNGAKVTQSITTVIGVTYHFSCFAQYNSGDSTHIEIEGVLEYPNGLEITNAINTWTYLETSFTATSTTSIVAVRERGGSNNASCYLYDISIKEEITASADMDVTRATAATRVDENGLVNYAEILSAELVVDGGFDDSGEWTSSNDTGGAWVISGGKATVDCSSNSILYNNNSYTIVTGTIYKCTFDITEINSGNVRIRMGSASGTSRTAVGTYTEYIVGAASSVDINFEASFSSGFNGSIDNVSVKEAARDNVPRIDYTGGGCPHILAEPQRTNLVLYSQFFDSSQWIKKGTASVTDNTSVSPSGLTNACTLSDATDLLWAGNMLTTQRNVTSSTEYTFSIFVKNISSTTLEVGIRDSTDGTVTSESVTLTNEWQRVDITKTSGSSTSKLAGMIGGTDGDILIWGGQMEEGSYATSYIPTSASTVTRNQDQFTRDGIGSLINSTEGVLFAEMAAFEDDDDYRYLGLNDGTDDNRVVILYYLNNNRIRAVLSSGGVNFVDEYYTVSSLSDFHKIALKWKANDFSLWVNGVERATETSVTVPVGLSHLSFDKGGGTNTFNGKVKQLQVYKTALTDVQLAALTS